MADETIQNFVIRCINQHRSDDLYRAECEFRNCTPTEMDELYGESGQTRQQIIDGYKAREQKCDAAIEAVKKNLWLFIASGGVSRIAGIVEAQRKS